MIAVDTNLLVYSHLFGQSVSPGGEGVDRRVTRRPGGVGNPLALCP